MHVVDTNMPLRKAGNGQMDGKHNPMKGYKANYMCTHLVYSLLTASKLTELGKETVLFEDYFGY